MSQNYLSSSMFKFILTGEKFKDNKFNDLVTGINVPGMQLGIVNQGTPIHQLERPGDSISYNDLSIEFLVGEDLSGWYQIFQWLYELRNFNAMQFDNSLVVDASIVLLTNKSNPNKTLLFKNIFPYNLSDIQMSSGSELENISCEATFKFDEVQLIETV